MKKTGLVSVSFRSLTVDQIIDLVKDAGLEAIEWGSDVHAPCRDTDTLAYIVKKQKAAGLYCSSYGTYFRLGVDDVSALSDYISAAGQLGTSVLRIWAGNKNYGELTDDEKNHIISDGRIAARMAEAAGVVLCMECHGSTFTNCVEGALELMQAVNSPHFRMYWQPNPFGSVSENEAYAREIAPYVVNLHVFHWQGSKQLPLSEGLENWKRYLSFFDQDTTLLLEFVPGNDPNGVRREADALRELL